MNFKKTAFSLLMMLSSLGLDAQNSFTQFKLNKHNLVGKTDNELRIMRNEIFAVYGYIFNSEDLANHFNKQTWYEPLYKNVDDKLTEIDKYNINLIKEFEDSGKVRRVVMDSSVSYMVHAFQENDLNYQRTVEVTYPGYEWKKTIDKAIFGAETEPTIIKMEYLSEAYNSYDKPYWQLRKPVDEMNLNDNYIHTKKYGFPLLTNEFYAFFEDEPFLKFTFNDYYKVRVPNYTEPSIYIGMVGIDELDNTEIAKIYLGTIEQGIINILTINSKRKVDYSNQQYNFSILSPNGKGKSEHREIKIRQSSPQTKNSGIPTFYIQLRFEKDLEIVVENGLINGSNELNQTIWIE